MDGDFVRLLAADDTWKLFEEDWRGQCEVFEEDFEGYAEATFSVVRDIIREQDKRAGVFALKKDDRHLAMCQLNKAGLPKYDSPVLRVRFVTLSPDYDLGQKDISDYADVLVELLFQVIKVAYSDPDLSCKHIKYHLRSPADQQFFAAMGKGLRDRNVFGSIKTQGAWLYITLKDLEPSVQSGVGEEDGASHG